MSVIKVYSDPNRYISSSEQNPNVYDKVEDYPNLYSSIKSMIAGETIKSDLIIQNVQLLAWVQSVNDFEPKGLVAVHEYSLRSYIESTWGIIPPIYLQDEDLKNIEDIFPHMKNSGYFEKDLLDHLFKFNFSISDFTTASLMKIINTADFSNFEYLVQTNCIKKVLNHFKVDFLKQNKGFPLLADLLFGDPTRFSQIIISYALLKSYSNDLKKRFSGDFYKELSYLDIKYLKPGLYSVPDDLINAVSVELNQMLKNEHLTEDELIDIIHSTSGMLEQEFNLIYRYISNRNQLNKNQLVMEMKGHFSVLLLTKTELSDSLALLVSPPYPMDPAFIEINDWINWAVNEFIPYRVWLDSRNETDEKINDLGELFSEWVSNNYFEIKVNYSKTLLKLIPNIKQSIDNQKMTVLLVVDNLGVRWIDYIEELFNSLEFATKQVDTYVAAIPTETKFSKTALLSSNMHYNRREQDYKKLTEQTMQEYFQEKKIAYLTKINELSSLPEETDFIIINFLMIDEFMHADQNKMASSRNDMIKNELKNLVNKLCKYLMDKPNADVYVVSDHGSTRIMGSESLLIDSALIDDKISDKTERYITVSDTQLSRTRKMFEDVGYIFEREKYELDNNYIVAKGYHVFKKITSDSYTHGGITPEEILVPFLHFQRSNQKIHPPLCILRNDSFRFNVKSKLSFVVENTNSFEVNDLFLSLDSGFISSEVDEINIGTLSSFARCEVDFESVRILRMNNAIPTYISVIMNYKVGTLKYQDKIDLPIVVKSMQENKIDFDF